VIGEVRRRQTSSLFAMVRALDQAKMSCHDVEAQVIAHGLSSESAIVFFDALPTIDVPSGMVDLNPASGVRYSDSGFKHVLFFPL
jgi:hypothetical protein